MAIDRSTAKSGIETESISESDPELSEAFASATGFRVSLEKEANRHKEAMAAGERGWLGHPLGGRSSAPMNIAFLILALSIIIWLICIFNAGGSAESQKFWSDNADKILALAGTALGYIFGQKTS